MCQFFQTYFSDTLRNSANMFGVWNDCNVNMSVWQVIFYLDLIVHKNQRKIAVFPDLKFYNNCTTIVGVCNDCKVNMLSSVFI